MEIIINKKYKILNKIGEGAFGSIFKGQNSRTGEYVAIKVEPIKNETKLLKNESLIYQYLGGTNGVPVVKWYGKDESNYYMVINLLGESLQCIKNRHYVFSQKVVLQIGIQMLQLIKVIHENGLVHRDIKPDNFLFGLQAEKSKIYIIDFGFCKSYMKENKHIPPKQTSSLIGSKLFASVNAHNCVELSRRDDLESLGYILVYFYLGTLSWQDIAELDNVNDTIMRLKQQMTEGNKMPEFIVNYIKYVRTLEFDEKPNYSLINNLFMRELELITKNI
jgi:serine/threonine protein kinase